MAQWVRKIHLEQEVLHPPMYSKIYEILILQNLGSWLCKPGDYLSHLYPSRKLMSITITGKCSAQIGTHVERGIACFILGDNY